MSTVDELAFEAAQAAYLAIEGIGELEPRLQRVLQSESAADLQVIEAFSSEMTAKLALLARTISELQLLQNEPWESDSRIVLPILYELGAAYTLLEIASQTGQLAEIPVVSRETLRRLATKQVRAWLSVQLGVAI